MDEKEIIHFIRSMASPGGCGCVEAGPGDDAAVVGLPGGSAVVLSTDMVIEGTHFPAATAPGKVGVKAVGRALSDLAAMAAKPVCSLAALCIPEGKSEAYQRALCRSIHRESERFGAPLAGGDTGSGSERLMITVTVMGVAGPGGLLYRSGAQPGDSVCVTGALGGSLAGRHLTPNPLIEQSLALAERYDIHAMIDISDGLATDLLHIAEESAVGVSLRAGAIPVHPDVTDVPPGGGEGAVVHALNDGEDYELLFCLPPAQAEELASTGIQGTNVSIIGHVTENCERLIVWADGTKTELRDTGWRHLNSK